MRKTTLFIMMALVAFACAEPFDDSTINGRLDSVESRVTKLESADQELNSNVASIAQTMAAVQKNYTVASIKKEENGYTISFTDGQTVSIYNGTNGKDGDKGDKGDPGNTGETGPQGPSPVVSVAKEGDTFYWTVNGEFLKDNDGNKISASAGTAVAPKFKVEGQYWYVSVDGGASWEVVEGATVGASITVTEDDKFVYLALADGNVINLPKTSAFAVKVSQTDDVMIAAGSTVTLAYTVTNADRNTHVVAEGYKVEATIEATDYQSGNLVINVPEVVAGDAYVIIKAIKNTTSEYSAEYISFAEGILKVAQNAYTVSDLGGDVVVKLSTNADAFTYEIAQDSEWLVPAPATKAVRDSTMIFTAAPNTSTEARTAEITFSAEGIAPVKVTVVQKGFSNVIGPNLPASQCVDIFALENQTVQWTTKVEKNKYNWGPSLAANYPAEAAVITIETQDISTYYSGNVSNLSNSKYAIGFRYDNDSHMQENDAAILTVPVLEVKAGTRALLEFPFKISLGASPFINFEICFDGETWVDMTTIHLNYIDPDLENPDYTIGAVKWKVMDGDFENGLTFYSTVNNIKTNARFFTDQPHMFSAIYDFKKDIVKSEIKFRVRFVDARYALKYLNGTEEFNPDGYQPACYIPAFTYADSGWQPCYGPEIRFIENAE